MLVIKKSSVVQAIIDYLVLLQKDYYLTKIENKVKEGILLVYGNII